MRWSARSLAWAAMIAALYCVLTLAFAPISYGPVQFRVSEALTLLPVFTPDAVAGQAVGCLLANLLGGALWYDVVFGTLATLLAALCTRRLRANRPLAAAMPVLFNGLIVGPVVYFAYSKAPDGPFSMALLLKDVGSVALGELVVCFALGLLLVRALEKAPQQLWE